MHDAPLREHAADPSLVELARVEGKDGERALLVVYPRSACSGSASGVLVDNHGHFLGAVAPGNAALIRVPADQRTVTSFSSAEVTAPAGAWFATDEIAVPAAPAGHLFGSPRASRHCGGGGQYPGVVVGSNAELEEAFDSSDLRLLDANGEDARWHNS